LKIVLIQHTAVDGPGATLDFLKASQADFATVRIDRGESIPIDVDADVLMTFGGPVSLYQPNLPSWVDDERALISRYVDAGRKVFGICLGAQLIASALGAKVYAGTHPEIGWHKIQSTDTHGQSAIADSLPPSQTVLQWHQNTFDLPADAVHLYQSDACSHQAFSIEDRIVGFQFHPEATRTTVKHFLRFASPQRFSGGWVQTEQQVVDGIERYLDQQNQWLHRFLSQWLN
jgi:GMP synthase-like glutamine amidotransferase